MTRARAEHIPRKSRIIQGLSRQDESNFIEGISDGLLEICNNFEILKGRDHFLLNFETVVRFEYILVEYVIGI